MSDTKLEGRGGRKFLIMSVFILNFKVNGKNETISRDAELICGLTSLSFKVIVDEMIFEWIENNAQKEKCNIRDIVLHNSEQEPVFVQTDYSDINSIKVKDFNQSSDSDLKYPESSSF